MNKPFLILLIIISHFGLAQNLVPNPSFEERYACPQFYPDLDGVVKEWTSFRGTPDYFHSCSSVCGFNNNWGYQEPQTSEAYAGFTTYHRQISEAREHIGVKLINPLTIGNKYYITFYVSSGYTPLQVNIATNKIGALVTTYPYSDPNSISQLPNNSTIYTNSIISDTVEWIKISGSFIADSAYQYLVIGCFFDDNNIDTLHFPYQVVPQFTYYYLDDVCLSTDSCLCDSCVILPLSVPNIFTPNQDGINDFFKINGLQNGDKVSVFNRWGQLVFKTKDINEFWDGTTLKGSPCPDGVYFYIIEQKASTETKKGTIHLMR